MGIPRFLQKYFWGDTISELDTTTHRHYILQTLLEKGDSSSIKWLLGTYGENIIKSELPNLKLSKKSSNYWHMYFS
jgi:hypothetical protein